MFIPVTPQSPPLPKDIKIGGWRLRRVRRGGKGGKGPKPRKMGHTDTGKEASISSGPSGFLSPLLHATWADRQSVPSVDRVPQTKCHTLGKEHSPSEPLPASPLTRRSGLRRPRQFPRSAPEWLLRGRHPSCSCSCQGRSLAVALTTAPVTHTTHSFLEAGRGPA